MITKRDSSLTMLQWQFRTLISELSQVNLHAASDDCPCNQVELDPPEYCLGKHLLNVSSLASETALMIDTHRDTLDDLSSEAVKYHEKAKKIYCKGGTWPDLASWARDWRKKIEPIYYACKAKLHDSADLEAKPKKEPGGPPVWCSGVESVARQIDRLAESLLRTKAQMSTVRGNLLTALNICAGQAQLLADAGPISVLDPHGSRCRDPKQGTGRKGAPNPFAVCQKSVGCRKDDARIDKLAQALIEDRGRFRESGYTVCQQGKKLVHGPHADGDHSSVTVSVACPTGAKPIAIYHTHPPGHLEPSDLDLKASRRFGVPVCIGQTDGPTVKCHQG